MKITKRYARKVSHDYQSWEFLTEITKDVEVNSKEELITESDKLFKTVKALTTKDIQSVEEAIGPQKAG